VTVLLTGATGFLGMEVLLRLLETGDEEEVVALVRGADQREADARLGAALDLVGAPRDQRHRVRAVRGDLTGPAPVAPADTTAIVHCAASVSFGLPLDEARAINVEGTRRVLDLAQGLAGLERVVHVSTAYVAGRHAGRFRERDLWVGQEFRNTYERTKAEAEALVRERAGDLPAVVVRPSIVVGESSSGWTPAFNVIYPALRAFARGLLRELPVRRNARVDLVPVDYVADAIVHALCAPDPPPVLHTTAGEDAPTVDRLVDLTCALMGRERPAIVPVGSREDAGATYTSYFDMQVVFDDAESRASLAAGGIVAPPPPEDYFGPLLDFAQRARWGKHTLARAEAHAGARPRAA
jgi:nucleoside-diphosphate-sugar epimerase